MSDKYKREQREYMRSLQEKRVKEARKLDRAAFEAHIARQVERHTSA